jgi:hypothetical protein
LKKRKKTGSRAVKSSKKNKVSGCGLGGGCHLLSRLVGERLE